MARAAIKRNAVLEFIRSKGPDGARFTDIQRFIVEMNGMDFDEMREENVWNSRNDMITKVMVRRWRGYWCTYLSGSRCNRRPGILDAFCEKLPNGCWILKEGV